MCTKNVFKIYVLHVYSLKYMYNLVAPQVPCRTWNEVKRKNIVFLQPLSSFRLILLNKKSDLAQIKVSACHQLPEGMDLFDSYIFDGGRFPYWCRPKAGQIFGQYAEDVIFWVDQFFKVYGFSTQHIMFDVYKENSLKAATREKRGKGSRRVVAASHKVPNNWQDFLRDTVNKDSLNKFLAETIKAHSYERGKSFFFLMRGMF